MFSGAPDYTDLIQLSICYVSHIGKILQGTQNNIRQFSLSSMAHSLW